MPSRQNAIVYVPVTRKIRPIAVVAAFVIIFIRQKNLIIFTARFARMDFSIIAGLDIFIPTIQAAIMRMMIIPQAVIVLSVFLLNWLSSRLVY
jgi:hypothetical protein